jgi:hypothetical protein
MRVISGAFFYRRALGILGTRAERPSKCRHPIPGQSVNTVSTPVLTVPTKTAFRQGD